MAQPTTPHKDLFGDDLHPARIDLLDLPTNSKPTTVPNYPGQVYFDRVNRRVYVARNVTSPDDWLPASVSVTKEDTGTISWSTETGNTDHVQLRANVKLQAILIPHGQITDWDAAISAHPDVQSANMSKHDAVTIGIQNGLVLTGQALSLEQGIRESDSPKFANVRAPITMPSGDIITADTTLSTVNTILRVSTVTGPVTITLPQLSTSPLFVLKDVGGALDVHPLTLVSADAIDGNASPIVLNVPHQAIAFGCVNSAWVVFWNLNPAITDQLITTSTIVPRASDAELIIGTTGKFIHFLGPTIEPVADFAPSTDNEIFTMTNSHQNLFVNTELHPSQVILPPATEGRVVNIKDDSGNSYTNNITLLPMLPTESIEGASQFVINSRFASWRFIFSSTRGWRAQ